MNGDKDIMEKRPGDQAAADAPELDGDSAEDKEQAAGSHERARENLSILWTFISTFVVACVVIAALALVVVKVSGCYLFTIETSSMAPAYPANTLVVVKPYGSFSEVEVGDVVTYVMNSEGLTVTHRVVSVDTANETVTTQGDANNTADASPVLYGNIVGKVVIGIPGIGKLIEAITAEENRPVVIAVIAAVLIWGFAWDWICALARKIRARKNK